jgi:hypothetical protein
LRFRNITHQRVLWIDSICIDQNAIEERNHQVKLMGNVYQRANRVLIWLGEEGPTTELAYSFMRAYGELSLSDDWEILRLQLAIFCDPLPRTKNARSCKNFVRLSKYLLLGRLRLQPFWHSLTGLGSLELGPTKNANWHVKDSLLLAHMRSRDRWSQVFSSIH